MTLAGGDEFEEHGHTLSAMQGKGLRRELGNHRLHIEGFDGLESIPAGTRAPAFGSTSRCLLELQVLPMLVCVWNELWWSDAASLYFHRARVRCGHWALRRGGSDLPRHHARRHAATHADGCGGGHAFGVR